MRARSLLGVTSDGSQAARRMRISSASIAGDFAGAARIAQTCEGLLAQRRVQRTLLGRRANAQCDHGLLGQLREHVALLAAQDERVHETLRLSAR